MQIKILLPPQLSTSGSLEMMEENKLLMAFLSPEHPGVESTATAWTSMSRELSSFFPRLPSHGHSSLPEISSQVTCQYLKALALRVMSGGS